MTEESVALEEVSALQDEAKLKEFPCIVIDGIETENEFIFFKDRVVDDPELCIPMYFECENEMVKIGMFPLTLDFLLVLRSIGGYSLTLYTGEDECKPIDLDDVSTLMKFIKL